MNSKKIVSILLMCFIMAGVSYILIYKVSFLPNGYAIISEQNQSILLKTYNILGVSEGISTVTFSGDALWKKDEILYQVNRYKEFLWLFFTFVGGAIFLLVRKVRQKVKWWKAILESNIILAIVIPGIQLVTISSNLDSLLY